MNAAKTTLFCIAAAIAGCVAAFGVFVLYATITDTAKKPAHRRVAFSEFLSEVEAGSVDQLAVSGRIYTFRAGSRVQETVGPKVDASELASIHSSNPALPAPKITTGAL
ncbi:MAG: hypothetical protein ABI183_19675 [Polyangiaceae bacterium]